MPLDLFANNAATTLTAAVTTTPSAGTSETWTVASTGLPLPQIVAGQQYRVTVGPATDPSPEIVWVTAVLTSTTLTVLRGQEGTVIKTHASGDGFTHTVTAGALTGLPSGAFTPADHGLLAWPYDPQLATNSTALTPSGTITVVKVHFPTAAGVTNVITQVTTAGATLTSGQCFAGIYQAGALLAATADQSAVWNSTGIKTMPLAGAPIAVPAGDLYIALLYNGTTGPTIPRASGNAIANVGLAATASRCGTANTSQTSLPSTLGAITALTNSFWVGLS